MNSLISLISQTLWRCANWHITGEELEFNKTINYATMALKQVYIVITGRVQGVGFRYFALDKAEEFHITGWVKNTYDGKVEMEACGEVKNLDTFIDWMKIGPARAIIHTFTVNDVSPERNFTNFTVR